MTLEEFLAFDTPGRFDLIDGELHVAGTSIDHGILTGLFVFWLNAFVLPRKLGVVCGSETAYVVKEGNPPTVLLPDVSFLPADRVPPRGTEGHFRGAPEVAVEIVSPSERPRAVRLKVRRYLEAGTLLVWCVYDQRRQVAVHRPDREPVILGPADVLDGGDVLPGLALPLSEVFR
jgi:Uma2 family endonuclease